MATGGRRLLVSWGLVVLVACAGIRPGMASAAGLDDEVIALQPASQLSEAWSQTFLIPYGDTPDTLGVSPGGDDAGILIGPDYGAQAPDGTWWFLDGAKQRVARFTTTGQYLEEVVLGPDLLVDGLYFQYQLPRVLADGTLYATNLLLGATGTWVLRVRDGVADLVVFQREFNIRADDGQHLYGFDVDNGLVQIDVDTATVADTEWFRTRRGDRFRLSMSRQGLRVELPDAHPPVDRTWPVVEAATGRPALGSVQAATDAAGTLHLYFTAIDETETKDLIGYTAISSDGRLAAVEPARAPFGPSDPGSPANLGVPVGGTTPWLMFVDEDGVRVFQRERAISPPVRSLDDACPREQVPAHGFSDVTSVAAHGHAIACVTWWQVASGTTATTYTPAAAMSRGQMATFVARLLAASGVTLPDDPPDHFTDDDGLVHEPNINRLAELGVVTGRGAGSYQPRGRVSRGQTASLLVRAYELAAGQELQDPADFFVDDDDSVHETAINRAAGAGFTAGVRPQHFGPRSEVTRAQMASFAARVLDLLVEQGIATTPQ